MKTPRRFFLLPLMWLVAAPAAAALNIFACTPEWGALSKELGGDKANVYVATNALQDPHHVEARPSLIARARSADLVVCTGAQLEIGWLPLVLTQAGNAKIQAGQPGYFEAARFAAMLEVPASVDRSQGDIHPGGNPHCISIRATSPRSPQHSASAWHSSIRPKPTTTGRAPRRFSSAGSRRSCAWEKEAAPLKGMPLIVYHKNMTYLIAWLGMREVGCARAETRVAADRRPSDRSCSRSSSAIRRKAIVLAAYNDPRGGDWLARARENSAC